MLRAVLGKWGYETVEARDGNEAWDHLVGPTPAPLAIMDWTMPGLCGPELCRRLRARDGALHSYLILLTARTHWQDVVEGLEAGADDYVAKPYRVEELRARLNVGRRIVGLQHELMELNDQLERRVEDRTERLRRILQQNQELFVHLGHDMRTPLTPLVALLPMLTAEETDLERRNTLKLCLDQACYLRRLAERVFDLGRLGTAAPAFVFRPVRLRRVVEAALESIANGVDATSARGAAVVEIPEGLEVNGDLAWLQRVFEDLLDNAFRFSGGNSGVSVVAEPRDGEVMVVVTDHGRGLGPDQLERVFDPFYTGDSARHDRQTSGLGLALCRRVIERHGGRIWAESPGLGRGTSIRFLLSEVGAKVRSNPHPDFS